MNSQQAPRQVIFDRTAEIFATDSSGNFNHPLRVDGAVHLDTAKYDEMRFVVSLWHPSGPAPIDLDRAYVELRACFEPEEEHWVKLAVVLSPL